MKRGPLSPPEATPLLAFGAHPDDIEFGCGGVVANETAHGRPAYFAVCSRGESATNGTPAERTAEAEKAADLLGATLEWLELDGDAHLEVRAAHAVKLAAIIRRRRPGIVLAPSLVENQHPDHARLGRLVRDAARLARYGGIAELRQIPAHAIDQLFYYAVTPEAEPKDVAPIIIDISASPIIATWTAAMAAHVSQMKSRNYVELQLARARLNGLRAGVEYGVALYPNDALVVNSLAQIQRGSRTF